MKILVASVNHEHPNTMHINFYHALAQRAEVSFFGPGFSTEDELKQGITYYDKKNGPFDVVICAFPLIMASIEWISVREAYKWNRFFLSDYSVSQAIRYGGAIINEIRKMEQIKILLYGQDIINLSGEWERCVRELLSEGFYILSPGKDFIPFLKEENRNVFGDGLRINNSFRELIGEYEEQSISIPFAAAACGEYFFGPLENREYDWVVPGNIDGCYPARTRVLQEIERAGYCVFNQFIDRTMSYRTDRQRTERSEYCREIDRYIDGELGKNSPYLKASLKREEAARWRENYNISLRKSKAAYADGGDGRMIVRKYIEIPARGTLLACEDIVGLDKLGFQDGENMVIVTPETVVEISEKLFQNPDEMQRIARNGQKLVLSKHTSENRAEAAITAIEAILENRFCGSYWDKGEFRVKERQIK